MFTQVVILPPDRSEGKLPMAKNPHPYAARVISDPKEVDLRLAKLGLSRPPLVDATLAGDVYRRSRTEMDAPGADGYFQWDGALRVLREQTAEAHQWHRELYLRIPVTFNNDESIAIAVSSGDENTGRNGPDPSTKNVKGSATEDAVDVNRKLPFGRGEAGVDFWYLLIDATDDGVWAELARPILRDAMGRVNGWTDRLLLGRVDLEEGAALRVPHEPPSYDVKVSRRKTA